MSGWTSIPIREHRPPTEPDLLILMSAVNPRGNRADFLWNGFIRKPFDIDVMLDLVKKLIAPGG